MGIRVATSSVCDTSVAGVLEPVQSSHLIVNIMMQPTPQRRQAAAQPLLLGSGVTGRSVQHRLEACSVPGAVKAVDIQLDRGSAGCPDPPGRQPRQSVPSAWCRRL